MRGSSRSTDAMHRRRRYRFWLGSSRGHWDGDTLTVETTNFAEAVSFRGSDEQLRVVERFRLDGPDALRYEFTIDDPTAFTRRGRARSP